MPINFKTSFWITFGFAIVFLLLWLVFWVLFAYHVTHPKIRTIFEIKDASYINDMHSLTDLLSNILSKNNFKHCLAAGSALGAGRFGHALEHDDDVDIFIAKSDIDNIYNVLALNEEIVCKYASFGLQLHSENLQGWLDMFAIAPSSGKTWKYVGHTDKTIDFLTDAEWQHQIVNKPFGQYLIPQLEDPNRYLTGYYGTDWKTVVVVRPFHSTKTSTSIWKGFNIRKVLRGL
jgi:hypothetical protein